ncbi:MAG: dihydropteroate synthase [Chloroflexi bacterium]|nr:dihydropteroate synthase [Chloroflexota bacterium]
MITTLKGRTTQVEISPERPTAIIGERINPTGKPRLAKAISEKNWDTLRQEALSQVGSGASIIDVNVGAAGADETVILPEAVKVVAEAVGAPICIDSSDPVALEAALRVCPGRALINSTTGEEKSMAAILPLAAKYGAAVIALCHDEEGISGEPEKRFAVAQKIIARAREAGLEESDLLFDPLVLPVGVGKTNGTACLATASLLSGRLGMNLTLGASNVSFGLPDRHVVNNSFLCMAIWCGVNAPIVNPGGPGLRESILAADLIAGKDPDCMRYIKNYRSSRQRQ